MLRRYALHLTTATAALLVGIAIVAAPPARASDVRIYPLGDSITFGSAPDGPTPGGYRLPLTRWLTADGVEHEFVGASTANTTRTLDRLGQSHHDGHPGYRVEQVAAGLDGFSGGGADAGGSWLTGTVARPAVFPDVTLIHLGTNDISQRYDPGTAYPTPDGKADLGDSVQRATFVAHLAARLHALVDKVQALRPGSRVVLSNVVPMADAPLDAVTFQYAAAVADVVARERANGARVVLADVWGRFASTRHGRVAVTHGLLTPDNVHPTAAGYTAIASVYRRAVPAVLALP